jgi:hypothetical protein
MRRAWLIHNIGDLKLRFAKVCVLALVVLPTSSITMAQARQRAPVLAPECNVSMNCDLPVDATRAAPRSRDVIREERRVKSQPARVEAMAYAPATIPAVREAAREDVARRGVSMAGIVAPLAAKVAAIQSACPGAHVISAVRHTRIRGSRHMSLHATGEAVDMRGNPSCVYAQLRDWPGGYSTDYARAQHIHISLAANGREAGLRFVHGGGKSHRHRRFAEQ